MANPPFQCGARVADPERQGRRVVDAHVPFAAGKRLEVAGIAIAQQLFDVARPFLRLAPAIEKGHLMPARQGVSDLMRTDESGPAEDQNSQPHGRLRRSRRRPGRQGDPSAGQPPHVASAKAHRTALVGTKQSQAAAHRMHIKNFTQRRSGDLSIYFNMILCSQRRRSPKLRPSIVEAALRNRSMRRRATVLILQPRSGRPHQDLGRKSVMWCYYKFEDPTGRAFLLGS